MYNVKIKSICAMKLTIRLLACFFLLAFLTKCSNSGDNNVAFYSKFDKYTMNEHTLTTDISAHSGSTCSRIDSANVFSFGYVEKLTEISKKPIKKVIVNAWVNMPVLTKDVALVVSINSPGKCDLWSPKDITEYITEPNIWTEISYTVSLTQKYQDNCDLRVYLLTKKGVAYLDDLKVTIK
jgi:hypothetical protein